ncbi:MAG TPA: DMT family transporter [Sphaerochaetaceae bacterium]|nr:DMT family transporter [Sphaerochaetaceae bacterium]
MKQSPPSSSLARLKSKLPMIKLFMAPVIWGGALAAGRIVSAELPAFTTSFIRFLIASLFMVPALYLKEKHFPKPTKHDLLWIGSLSIVGVVIFNVLLFTSLETITAVRSSVLLAFTPVVVAIVARILFKEKLTLLIMAGIVLATIGAVLTITNGDIAGVIASGLAIGDIYMLGAVLAWAAYSIIIKQAMSRLSPLALLTYGSVTGVLILFPITLMEQAWSQVPTLSGAAIWSLLYLSIGAAGLAYLWYYEGIAKVGSSKASVFLNVEPVAAIALGVLLLGEELSLIITIGAILVISGLVLTNHRPKSKL